MKNSKSRTAGGLGIGLVALGLLLGLMFKGPGFGGKGTEDGAGAEPSDLTNVKVQAPGGVDIFGDEAQPVATSATAGNAASYVTVIIHGDGYRYAPSGDPATGLAVELTDLVNKVQSAPGTPEGIKLRVLLHTSAREGARADLLAQLQQAGIKPEAIQEVSGFVK